MTFHRFADIGAGITLLVYVIFRGINLYEVKYLKSEFIKFQHGDQTKNRIALQANDGIIY